MPSYEDRSRLIKQLSEQQYFDALKKPQPQKKDVRSGAYDGLTGRYEVLHADGGVTRNGIPLSNAAPPTDGFVRGQQSPNNNAIALGYRDFRGTEFVNRTDEEVEFFNLSFRLLRLIPYSTPLEVIFLAEWFFFEEKPEDESLQNQLWTQNGETAEEFIEWDTPNFPTEDLPSRDAFNGVWYLSFGTENPIDPDSLTYTYSADNEWIEFSGFFGASYPTLGYLLDLTFFADPEQFPFIQDIEDQTVTNDSEIEVEIETNVGTVQDIFYANFGDGFFGLSINSVFPDNGTITTDTYSFRVRYRRRVTEGDPLPWFQL